jgi:hypothetical protein
MSNLQDRSYDFRHIGGVRFTEDTHIYDNAEGEIYRSSTGILKDFKNPFDSEGMSRYKAIKEVLPTDSFNKLKKRAGGWDKVKDFWEPLLKHSNTLRIALEQKQLEFLKMWKDKGDLAAHNGSIEHGKREEDIIKNGFYWMNKYYPYSTKNILEVTKEDMCAIPELLLWDHAMKLGGLADLPLFEKGYVHIHDFKTNEEIKRNAFNNQGLQMFLAHIPDCSYYHYSLQLGIYREMACRLTGLKPGECWIISTKNPEYGRNEDEYIKCANVDKEVKLIFDYYENI